MRKKLLIADDDGDICALLKTVFEDKFDVAKVKNGKELIEKAVREKPDLIITDVVMPSVSGYRAIKKLSGEPGFDNSA
ncbi:MAG: response regulator, partial [Elusimicrobiota bacterium]